MLQRRELKGSELSYSIPNFQQNILMSIKFEYRKSTEKAFKNFEKMVAGLHLKVKKNFLCETDEPTIINILPRQITNPRDAMEWTFLQNLYPATTRLGSISYSEHNNLVVLNVSHLLVDGGLMKIYFDNCLSDKLPKITKIPLPPLFTDESITQSLKYKRENIKDKIIKFHLRKRQIKDYLISSRVNNVDIDAKYLKN